MIRSWRRAWGVGDFPFLFVQLASWTAGPGNAWPELREAQREALTVANTGMAVAIDVGLPTDIHPRDKKTVGTRLALAARAHAYGETLAHSGPLFRHAVPEGSALRASSTTRTASPLARAGPSRASRSRAPTEYHPRRRGSRARPSSSRARP
jgi:sialate O-acetylesterase